MGVTRVKRKGVNGFGEVKRIKPIVIFSSRFGDGLRLLYVPMVCGTSITGDSLKLELDETSAVLFY